MGALSEDKKRLLRQIRGFRLVLGEGQSETVKRRIKAPDDRLQVYFASHNE